MEVLNSNKSTTKNPAVHQGSSNNIALLTCIRTTQEMLGKHICRPPLLLKYLIQPPFLFFHDIITSVITTKGFLRGLFTADELDRNKARSLKENRINFFEKLIRALHATTGERFPKFNLAKMSTGRHPLSVNRLLHSIAFALDMAMNSELAVMQVNGQFDSEFYDKGAKRKLSECTLDEDEYFGDDESENRQLSRKAQTKKAYRKELAENDDIVSMAYEKDMATFDQNGIVSLQDIHHKVVRTLSNLSIQDDSENTMEIL